MNGVQMAYAILAGVSGGLFLISLLFGGIADGIGGVFDTDTDGPAGLSLSTLLAAFTAVGVIGRGGQRTSSVIQAPAAAESNPDDVEA